MKRSPLDRFILFYEDIKRPKPQFSRFHRTRLDNFFDKPIIKKLFVTVKQIEKGAVTWRQSL